MVKLRMNENFYYKHFLEIADWIEKNCRGPVDTSPQDMETRLITYSFKYRVDALAFSLKYL